MSGEWRVAGAEARNAYGFPMARADAPDDWYADLPEAERAGLRRLQGRVERALRGILAPDLVRWACEETLWQIRMELRRQGRVALPDVGTLELVHLPDGRGCLLAVASPSLAGEVTP